MKSFGIIIYMTIAAFLVMLFISCSDDKSTTTEPVKKDITVANINQTTCKSFYSFIIEQAAGDCIEYSLEGSVLHIKHINAGFNCCPGKINVNIEVVKDTIIVNETESEAGCKCLCLFDITYDLQNVAKTIYHLKIVEPYVLEEEGKLEFVLNLQAVPSGNYCVNRAHYPWQ